MSEGIIIVKGLCYEDLVAILTTNGYDVNVEAQSTSNATHNTYIIKYKNHDYLEDCAGAF